MRSNGGTDFSARTARHPLGLALVPGGDQARGSLQYLATVRATQSGIGVDLGLVVRFGAKHLPNKNGLAMVPAAANFRDPTVVNSQLPAFRSND
jgi:hypothetical protein